MKSSHLSHDVEKAANISGVCALSRALEPLGRVAVVRPPFELVQQDETEWGERKAGDPSDAGEGDEWERHGPWDQDVDFSFATAGPLAEPEDAVGGSGITGVLEVEKARSRSSEKLFENFCGYVVGGRQDEDVCVLRKHFISYLRVVFQKITHTLGQREFP
jgi:hypothetical protein